MKMMWIFLALAIGTISQQIAAEDEISHEDIRRLVANGELMSLRQIKHQHPEYFEGRILELEVESDSGNIIYELEILDKNHRIIELEIDAKTGKLIEEEVKRNHIEPQGNSGEAVTH